MQMNFFLSSADSLKTHSAILLKIPDWLVWSEPHGSINKSLSVL